MDTDRDFESRDLDESLYADIERIAQPIIHSAARLFARQLDVTVEDAAQEARFAIWGAAKHYRYTASNGGMLMFFRRSVHWHLLHLLIRERRQRRHPFMVVDGVAKPIPFETPPDDFDGDPMDLYVAPVEDPEQRLLRREREEAVAKLIEDLDQVLDARSKSVLRCRVHPPLELLMLMHAELTDFPTTRMIQQHLGLSRNAVGVSLRRIRAQMTECADE